MPSSNIISKHHVEMLKLERKSCATLKAAKKDYSVLARVIAWRVERLRDFRLINDEEATLLRSV